MPQRNEPDGPRTAGELRRLIAEKGHQWTVDLRLRDGDPLPKYARGGKPEKEPKGPKETTGDLSDFLREYPPSNPFLRARWTELKLLSPDAEGIARGSTPDIVPRPKEDKP
jgi:hypothetical protein